MRLYPNVDFSGWSLGSGFWGIDTNDVLGFTGDLGNTGETDLVEALANDRYLSFTVDPTADFLLDLRGAEFSFTIDRIDGHAPRKYSVMSSIDGFGVRHLLYESERYESLDPVTMSFTLPIDEVLTDQAVEFRIYAYEGQYAGHNNSLIDFRLDGAAVLVEWIADNPEINIAPIASAGEDTQIIDDGNGSEIVSLDGTNSRDFDGCVTGCEWELNGKTVGTEARLDVTLSVRIHQFELIVTDDADATRSRGRPIMNSYCIYPLRSLRPSVQEYISVFTKPRTTHSPPSYAGSAGRIIGFHPRTRWARSRLSLRCSQSPVVKRTW